MVILNIGALKKFLEKRPDAANAVNRWIEIVKQADWKSHNDIKQYFPNADYVGNDRYVFNIRGNNYRLVAVVVFFNGFIRVQFIGTHREYDKIDCKNI